MNMTESNELCNRLNEALGENIAQCMIIGGVWYLVTDGTGEGVFAYRCGDDDGSANDVEAGVAAARTARACAGEDPYEAFCREADPVHDAHTATAVWRGLDVRVCVPGCGDVVPLDAKDLLDSEIVELCAVADDAGKHDDDGWLGVELYRRIGSQRIKRIGAETRRRLLKCLEEVAP